MRLYYQINILSRNIYKYGYQKIINNKYHCKCVKYSQYNREMQIHLDDTWAILFLDL